MLRKIFLSLLLLCLTPYSLYSKKGTDRPTAKKDLKVLVLIIATDNESYYRAEQDVWRSYMHLDPEHVEAYFIKGDPDLDTMYKVKDNDVLWSKTVEGTLPSPGVLNKILLSLEFMLPRLHEFDYVVKTGLTTFYSFPNLLKFLRTLPKNRCYCGPITRCCKTGVIFAQGDGYIMSSDLAQLLAKKRDLVDKKEMDDVSIAKFFISHGIRQLNSPRVMIPTLSKWLSIQNNLPAGAFHFRFKNEQERRTTDEVQIAYELLNKFYSK